MSSILSMLLQGDESVTGQHGRGFAFRTEERTRGEGEPKRWATALATAFVLSSTPALSLSLARRRRRPELDLPLVSEWVLHGSDDLGEELLALLDVSSLSGKVKLSHGCFVFSSEGGLRAKEERRILALEVSRKSSGDFFEGRGKGGSARRGETFPSERRRLSSPSALLARLLARAYLVYLLDGKGGWLVSCLIA